MPFMWLVLLASLLTGCSLAAPPVIWSTPAVNLSWPEDSAQPRVRFLRGLDEVEGLGTKSATGIFSWVTGEQADGFPLVSPYGIAADGRGRLWIADRGIQGVHVVDLARNSVEHIFQAGADTLQSPVGVALDLDRSRWYVSDSGLNSVYAFDLAGRFLSRIESSDGYGRPGGLAVDGQGFLYVVDTLKNRVLIFTPQGDFSRQLTGVDAKGTGLHFPTNVAVDQGGYVAVVDSMNFRVVVFAPDGEVHSVFGMVGDVPGTFARPRGVAFDSDSHIYVVDAAFSNVQIFDLAGRLLMYFSRDGNKPGELALPAGIFIDRADRIYVTDAYNRRVQIFQYIPERGARP